MNSLPEHHQPEEERQTTSRCCTEGKYSEGWGIAGLRPLINEIMVPLNVREGKYIAIGSEPCVQKSVDPKPDLEVQFDAQIRLLDKKSDIFLELSDYDLEDMHKLATMVSPPHQKIKKDASRSHVILEDIQVSKITEDLFRISRNECSDLCMLIERSALIHLMEMSGLLHTLHYTLVCGRKKLAAFVNEDIGNVLTGSSKKYSSAQEMIDTIKDYKASASVPRMEMLLKYPHMYFQILQSYD